MSWLELTVQTTAQHTDAISAFLEQQQAVAITWKAADAEELFEPELDSMPLWSSVNVTALFPKTLRVDELLHSLSLEFDQTVMTSYRLDEVANQQWEYAWLADCKPLCFGNRLWVCPSVLDPPVTADILVRLDPGLAFGTGTHPSTALCLQWLVAHIKPGQVVVDYGCGSGILAIAAIKCGAEKVFAIDHDPQAIEATQLNTEKNEILPEKLVCYLSSQAPLSHQADVLLANILAKPLMRLASDFKQLIKPKGQVVLAGLLREQVVSVQEVYSELGFMVTDIQTQQDWSLLVLSAPP